MAANRGEAHAAMRERILHGPLGPSLLKLAWPTATASALQGLVAAVDVVMVGRLGETAVAATTTSNQALMLMMVAGSAVGMGGGTLVAQAIGRGDRERADQVFTQCLLSFLVVLCGGLIPLGWVLTPTFLRLLAHGDAGVIAVGVPYMRVMLFQSVFTVMGFAAGAGLRGAGDTKTPLRVAVLTNVVHIPANAIFIFGIPALGIHGLGVVGAACGTLLARMWMNSGLLYWLARGKLAIRFLPPSQWRFELPVFWDALRIGVPASLSSIVLNLNGVLVISILARTSDGSMALAAYGLSNTFRNFGTWMTWGLSDATSTMVGQNIGARQRRRARAAGLAGAKMAALFMVGMGLLLALLAPLLFSLVLREPDLERKRHIIHIATLYLVTQAVALPFLGVGMALEGALRGAGDAFSAMLNNILSFLVVGLPVCAFLALDRVGVRGVTLPGLALGPLGVWLGVSLAMITRGLSMLVRWRRTRWRSRPTSVL